MKLEAIAYKKERGGAMIEVSQTDITCAAGVQGDIYGQPGSRQVTLLSTDAWQKACEELGQDIPWTVRRSNLFISGISFGPEYVGKIVQIGDCQLEITKETEPCKGMDAQVPGLLAALENDWAGGVCCRVLRDGHIAIGDAVELVEKA